MMGNFIGMSQECLTKTHGVLRGMKLLIHPYTSMVQPLKFENGRVISPHTLLSMWLLIHAVSKVEPC